MEQLLGFYAKMDLQDIDQAVEAMSWQSKSAVPSNGNRVRACCSHIRKSYPATGQMPLEGIPFGIQEVTAAKIAECGRELSPPPRTGQSPHSQLPEA